MSRMSINFDNEEQYNKFIQSIIDEVIKELPKNSNGHSVKNAVIWNYTKSKVEELELKPYEDNQLKQALSTILRFGFKTKTVHLMPDHQFDEIKPSIDQLFDSILELRKHKRPEAYRDEWKIKEEF